MLRFSVVIPTRHRNDLLARCLERLAPGRQTLDASQYEVIVTDDGADSTAEQLIRDRFPWARWVRGPRRGPAANRNCGARAARAEWIAFTDDDCLPKADWLAAYAAVLAAGEPPDALEGKTVCEEGLRSIMDEAPYNLTGGGLPSCNIAICRAVFDAIGGFDEDFKFWCEDQYFFLVFGRAGYRRQFVPAAVVDHPRRRRPSGWQMGLRWEARILLWYKAGNRGSVWRFFPLHCLKVRVSQTLEYPLLQWDTVRAAGALVTELACLVTHLGRWDRMYRRFGPPQAMRGGDSVASASVPANVR